MNDFVRKTGTLPIMLMAEDDADDRFFMKDIFRSISCKADLRFVENGEELMEYLHRRGKFADPARSPRPSLILLDLNMPKRDGREVLPEIKADPGLKDIPIVIWSTSNFIEDITLCLEAGVEEFLTKPDNYAELEMIVEQLCSKWLSHSGFRKNTVTSHQ